MTTASRNADPPTVFIVEDDCAVREALHGLFTSVGLAARTYETAQAFLDDEVSSVPGCLVADVRLPGKSGLDLFDELATIGDCRPVVFISGHADVAMSVRAMKAGAVEFLTKPVRDQDLLDTVQHAIAEDRRRRDEADLISSVAARIETLTRREREIMAMVTDGYRNKEIAARAGVAEATVKLHRGNVMQKMAARSIADLIRMSDLVAPGPHRPKALPKSRTSGP